jgi:hypothetical protein
MRGGYWSTTLKGLELLLMVVLTGCAGESGRWGRPSVMGPISCVLVGRCRSPGIPSLRGGYEVTDKILEARLRRGKARVANDWRAGAAFKPKLTPNQIP